MTLSSPSIPLIQFAHSKMEQLRERCDPIPFSVLIGGVDTDGPQLFIVSVEGVVPAFSAVTGAQEREGDLQPAASVMRQYYKDGLTVSKP